MQLEQGKLGDMMQMLKISGVRTAAHISIVRAKPLPGDKQTVFFFFLLYHVTGRILVSQLGIEPMPPTVEARILNPWTTREVPQMGFWTRAPSLSSGVVA